MLTDDEKRELIAEAEEFVKYGADLNPMEAERLIGELCGALEGTLTEPEWEYGYELLEPDTRDVFERDGDFISPAFAYRAAKKRIGEEDSADVPRLQYLIVRRRKAGPWLLVEGGSNMARRPVCPHCGSGVSTPSMPLLDGTEVWICGVCQKIAKREDWER